MRGVRIVIRSEVVVSITFHDSVSAMLQMGRVGAQNWNCCCCPRGKKPATKRSEAGLSTVSPAVTSLLGFDAPVADADAMRKSNKF